MFIYARRSTPTIKMTPPSLFNRSSLQVLILTLGSFSLGAVVAYPSPALPALRILTSFTPLEESIFASAPSLTAIIGPFLISPILTISGRRNTARIVGVLIIAAWAVMLGTSAERRYFAFLHRFLAGIATGGVNSVIPVYINEISPVALRSVYGAMHQFGVSFGIFVVNFIGIFVGWEGIAVFCLVIGIGFVFALGEVPEPQGGTRLDYGLDEALCNGRHRRGLVVGLVLMAVQQASGINAVLVNLSQILAVKEGPALAASAQCFAVVCCIGAIERIGRINAWFVSLFGSALAMVALAAALGFGWGASAATIAAFGFLFCFCFGLGPIPWFLPPELFPDSVRGTAISVLASVNSAVSFAVLFLYPQLVRICGVVPVLGGFAVVLVAGGLFGFVAFDSTSRDAEVLLSDSSRGAD
jgi:MFS family permease